MRRFLTELEKAYIAGLVDGEGTLCMTRTNKKGKRRNKHYDAKFSLGMTDYNTMKFLADCLDLNVLKPKNQNPKWRQTYQITASNQRALKIIDVIEPYLITKKKQANIIQDFYQELKSAHKQKNKLCGTRRFVAYGVEQFRPIYKYNDEYIKKCEDFYERCNSLNLRKI